MPLLSFWCFVRNHWCSLTCDCITLISAFITTCCSSSVSVFTQPSPYKDTSHISLGPHPTPICLHLNQSHLQGLCFQIRSHLEELGVRTSTFGEGVENSIQLLTHPYPEILAIKFFDMYVSDMLLNKKLGSKMCIMPFF